MKKLTAILILCLLTVLLLPLTAQAEELPASDEPAPAAAAQEISTADGLPLQAQAGDVPMADDQLAILRLPAGLQKIEKEAFMNDKALEGVTLPNGLKTIGAKAFAASSVRIIYIPGSVTSIAADVFQNCSNKPLVVVAFGSYAHKWCVQHASAISGIVFDDEWAETPTVHEGDITATFNTAGIRLRCRFCPTQTANYSFYSTGSDDTQAWLYDRYGQELAKDDDGGDGLNFKITRKLTAGLVYYYEVAYWDSSKTGTMSIKLSSDAQVSPTAITESPKSVSAKAGETVTFRVTATGSGLKFQWQENSGSSWVNSTKSGSTTSTLSFKALSSHNGLKLRCVVSGADGKSVTSGIATLTVQAETGPKYRALLIAESNYTTNPLPGTIVDVVNMGRMLKSIKSPNGSAYTVYGANNEYLDSSPTEILNLISSCFAGAKEDDVSLFFIDSHAVDNADGLVAGAIGTVRTSPNHRYTLPNGSSVTLPDNLLVDELATALKAVPGRVIVIISACGSGAGIYAASYNDAQLEESFDIDAFNDGILDTFARYDESVEEVSAQTGELRVSGKFYVLTSSGHRETTWSNNTYGGIFIQGITAGVPTAGTMPADSSGDGIVTLNELYHYTYQYVLSKVNGQHVKVYPTGSGYKLFKR